MKRQELQDIHDEKASSFLPELRALLEKHGAILTFYSGDYYGSEVELNFKFMDYNLKHPKRKYTESDVICHGDSLCSDTLTWRDPSSGEAL